MSTIQCSFSISGYSRGDLVEHFVEETVRQLHDVVFSEAGDFLAIVAARVFKSVAHDLFRTRVAKSASDTG